MKSQIQLDSSDIMRQLREYLILYANVLDERQCKIIADMLQILYIKSL